MAVYRGTCVLLGLVLLACPWVESAASGVKVPDGCTVEQLTRSAPNLVIRCHITPTNINDVLYVMKQPEFIEIHLLVLQFRHFQFGEGAFHHNLFNLYIIGDIFSISAYTFRGLSNLRRLGVRKSLNTDNELYRAIVERDRVNGIHVPTYPLNINYTSPLFAAGWLSPLTNLEYLAIFQSNISSFRMEEFCTLNQLLYLELSHDRINSTERLGITCNSSLCTPCLPRVVFLDISGNPISEFNLNISMNLPSLRLFNISHCDLSVLYVNAATTESTQQLYANNNKLHSLLIDEEAPCIRPHLQILLLDNNQLRTISPGLFACIPHLQWLNMSGNALTGETLISAGLNDLTELKRLDLSHNNIKTLQPALIGNMTELLAFWCTACNLTKIYHDSFIHTRNLSKLVLDNNNLSMIDGRSLSHFLNLEELDLSVNALNRITVTENLLSLKVLDLSGNLFSEIPDFSGSWLYLSTLAMDRNQITDMDSKQISGLKNLKNLTLSFNNIQFIPENTFANQNILEVLDLSNNRIKTVSGVGLDKLPSLTHLRLDNNLLMQLPALDLLRQNLMFLDLSRNLIKTIDIVSAGSLRGIDLSHNHISQIKLVLINSEHLQYVNYSYNHLQTLDEKYFLTTTSPRPKVYIRGNPLRVDCHSEWLLDTKLDKTYEQILDVRSMKMFGSTRTWNILPGPKDDQFEKNVNNLLATAYYVKIADLDQTQCTTVTGENKYFSEMSSEDFVCKYTDFCHELDCPKDCCKDADGCRCSTFCYPECTCYRNWFNHSINFMNCSSRNMTSLPSQEPSYVRYINMDGNYITAMNSSTLNFPYLTKLNAANSHISHLPPGLFSNLKMLQVLQMEQNEIEKISKQTFIFLINLQELYLQGNKIHQIDNGSFDDLLQLRILWLHGNSLKSLHSSLFERMYSLRELTLYDNPWSCGCQFGPAFKEWLTHSESIVNRSRIYCNNTVPSDNTGPDSSQYNKTNIAINALSLHYQALVDIDFTSCINRSRVYHKTIIERVHSKSIVELVSLTAVFVVLVIFTLVIYKTRLLIRVWFYNKYGVRFHQGEQDNDEKPYDLFIAYAKADERLVLRELLPELEEEAMSYKVCLECRDWHPGTATTDAVVASVQLSKRTIVLVSPNHLDTQWCEYSFDAAHYQVLLDKQIRLILVLTDIELEARMTRAMKLYMKTNTFLVIGEKWFWKKLRYYLAVNPRGADHVVGREFRLMNAY